MRVVVQRVTRAEVFVQNQLVSSIKRGVCALIAVSNDDNGDDVEYIVRKLINLRLFENTENGRRWDKSVKDLELEILCVSQFTLYSSIKGNKLDFHRSMNPTDSAEFYNRFLDVLRKAYDATRIKDGQFGAHMKVAIENDGPVTVTIDSRNRE